MTWDSGKDFGKFRRFLFCFLSMHFSKHLFYFHSALKRMQENWGAGIKRERRILELRSLANPFSVKICVLFCAVMKRCKEKSCPHIIHHEASQKDLWLGANAPHCRLISLTSTLPNNALRRWFCPHSNCLWILGQELPQEKYLIPLSHTCGVSNSNTEIYFGHILVAQVKGTGKEAHLLESMRKSPKSFLG